MKNVTCIIWCNIQWIYKESSVEGTLQGDTQGKQAYCQLSIATSKANTQEAKAWTSVGWKEKINNNILLLLVKINLSYKVKFASSLNSFLLTKQSSSYLWR